ncbi:MAG: hypothetical protein WC708_03910 [Lentisphaeria bacterium]
MNTILRFLPLLGMLAFAGAMNVAAKPVTQPFGLSVAGPVQDGSQTAFGQNFASALYDVVVKDKTDFTNLTAVPGITSVQVDPSKIDLATAADVRVYFVGDQEGNGKDKTYAVGFNPAGPGVTSGSPELIFNPAQTNGTTTNSTFPLLPGDYVDLGQFAAGSHLDFFAIADPNPGYTTGSDADLSMVFSTADGNVNARAYALSGSPYLLITFEGRDKYGVDYNDVTIAVDIGMGNIRSLMGAPEPSLALLLGGFTGTLLLSSGRRRD